ncbi:MAG: hypothetical protein LBG48_01005 [Rickettsiales bacterium]|jgi:biopolymer transport protein ExbD|nr:hypothetical protein [Rickettsiales bacterium]
MSETKAKGYPKKTKPAPAQDIDKDQDYSLSEETSNDKELQSTVSEETSNNKENPSSLSEDASSIDNLEADTNLSKIQISDEILTIDIDFIEPDPDQLENYLTQTL